jgi:hypothetical protein
MPKRKPIKILPPVDYLRERLDYNPETGELRWKTGPRAGKITGVSVSRDYYTISIAGGVYQVHRIIWKWMTGEDPPNTIDHIENGGRDNRWANLRIATALQQQHNRRWFKSNAAGKRGVYPSSKNRWIARIRINHVRVYLGCFSTIEAAEEAYNSAAQKIRDTIFT